MVRSYWFMENHIMLENHDHVAASGVEIYTVFFFFGHRVTYESQCGISCQPPFQDGQDIVQCTIPW
jgi:hypothetical protein